MINRGLKLSLQVCGLFLLTALLLDGTDAQAPPEGPAADDGPNTLLWLAVMRKSEPSRPPMHYKFNRKAVDDFQQCMCRSDFARCQVLANGTVLEKNKWLAGRQNISYMCRASNDSSVMCDGLPPPGNDFRPPALNVFGSQCPLRNVSVYWDENQAADVSVREGYAGSMLRCADKCKSMSEMERREEGGLNSTSIALAVVCACLFIIAIALTVYCLIRRKRLRQRRVSGQEKKTGVVNDGIDVSEKKSAPIESVCTYTEKEKDPDMASFGSPGPYDRKGMANEGRVNRSYESPPGFPLLVWPTEEGVRPPDYEVDPPPYFSVFHPEAARSEGRKQNAWFPNSPPRGETDGRMLSLHLKNPRSRASIHTEV